MNFNLICEYSLKGHGASRSAGIKRNTSIRLIKQIRGANFYNKRGSVGSAFP